MREYRISTICDINKSTLSSADVFDTIRYLDTGSITDNEITELQELAIENTPSRAQRKVKDKTIIYSTVRPNLRHIGILVNPPENLIVSTGFATIDVKEEYKEKIDPLFLYYKLSQNEIVSYLHCIAENSVSSYPSINPSDIGNLSFVFPDFNVQQKISSTLSTLDCRINLNKQISRELESMAKELYDYWFVQFDFPDKNGTPYKASGGRMVYNERLKREIPEGWTVCTIGAIVANSSGGDWGKDDEARNYSLNVNCIRGADISMLTDLPIRYINKNNGNKLLSEWDIVIEISGGSPIQATGRSALVTNGLLSRYNSRLICSNFCQSLRLKKPLMSPYFFYMWNMFYDNNIMFNYEGKTSGIKNFLLDSFLANYWVFPPDQIAKAFSERIAKFFTLRDKNTEEILQLSKLHNELLPLLMNGQVTVNNIKLTIDNVIILNRTDYYDQRFDLWLKNQGLAARGDIDRQTLREIFDVMDDDDK